MFPRGNLPQRFSSPQKSPSTSVAKVFQYGADLNAMRFSSPQTPTARTSAYPPLTSRISEPPPRTVESADARRDSDHFRKRPSMMSDFSFEGDASSKRPRLDSSPSARRAYPTAPVEIKKEPAYTPQVENISPTPDDQLSDKDKILEQIKKLDQEIAVVETEIKRLHKQEKELTERTNAEPSEATEEVEEVVGQSLFERIYAENRKKAAASHAKLSAILGPLPTILPLYREPSDIPALIETRKKYETFKPKLILHLRKTQMARKAREHFLSERYNQLMQGWRKKIEKWENSQKRKIREAKYREIFEKTFPELKKQREEKERLSRCRMETRSGLLTGRLEEREKEAAAEAHAEQEEEERRMRGSAIVPPILLDPRSRCRYIYVDNNGMVRDPMKEHQDRLALFQILWSEEEKKIFREKFIQHGKNFAAISLFLEKKTTIDCVQYYYLTKKRENFKQLLRRHYRRRGKPYKPPQMPRPGCLHSKDDDGHHEVLVEEIAEPEYFCVICNSKIDGSNPGRVLTRAVYEQYGLDSDAGATNEFRICQKCRAANVRKRFAQCPVGTCASTKRKTKPTRTMPPTWNDISGEQKQIVLESLQIMDVTQKFCSGCFKRISRKIDALLSNEPEESGSHEATADIDVEWLEEDVVLLSEGIAKFGLDEWIKVAQVVQGKEADDCARYYERRKDDFTDAVNKAAAVAAAVKLTVQGIEDEEEEEKTESNKEAIATVSSNDDAKIERPDIACQVEQTQEVFVQKIPELVAGVVDKTSGDSKNEDVRDQRQTDKMTSESPRESVRNSLTVDNNGDSDATVSADEGGPSDDGSTGNSGDSKFMSIRTTEKSLLRSSDSRRGAINPSNLPECQSFGRNPVLAEDLMGSGAMRQSQQQWTATTYRKPKSDIASRVEREIEMESQRVGTTADPSMFRPVEIKAEPPSPVITAPPTRLAMYEQLAMTEGNRNLSHMDTSEVTVLKTITKTPTLVPQQRPPPLIRTPQESPHASQPPTPTNSMPRADSSGGSVAKLHCGSITQGTPVRPPPVPSPLQQLTTQGGMMGRSPLAQPSPQSGGLMRSFDPTMMLMRPPTPAGTSLSRDDFLSRQSFDHVGREEAGTSQQAMLSAAMFERHMNVNEARLAYMTAKQMGMSDEQAWMRYQQVLSIPEVHSQMLAEAAARDSNKQIIADFIIAQQIQQQQQQHAEASKREREAASVQHQLQSQQALLGDLARFGIDINRLDPMLTQHLLEQQQMEHRQQLMKQQAQAMEQHRMLEQQQQQQRLMADHKRVIDQRNLVEAHLALERQKIEQQRMLELNRHLQQQRMANTQMTAMSHGYLAGLDPKLRNEILMRGELERSNSMARSPLQQYHQQLGSHFSPSAQSPLPRTMMASAAAAHKVTSTPPQPTPSPKNPLLERTRGSPVVLTSTGAYPFKGDQQQMSSSQTPPAQFRTKGAMKMVTTKEAPQTHFGNFTEAQIKEFLARPSSPHISTIQRGFEPRSAVGSLHQAQLPLTMPVASSMPKTPMMQQPAAKLQEAKLPAVRIEHPQKTTVPTAHPTVTTPSGGPKPTAKQTPSEVDGWINSIITSQMARQTAESFHTAAATSQSSAEPIKRHVETTEAGGTDNKSSGPQGITLMKQIDDIITENYKAPQQHATVASAQPPTTTTVVTTAAVGVPPQKEVKSTPSAFVYEFEPVSPPDGENIGGQSDTPTTTTSWAAGGTAKPSLLRPETSGSAAATSPFPPAMCVFDLNSPVRIQTHPVANYPPPPTTSAASANQNASLPTYEPLSDEETSGS